MSHLKGSNLDEFNEALRELANLLNQMRQEAASIEVTNIKRTLTETIITLVGILTLLDEAEGD